MLLCPPKDSFLRKHFEDFQEGLTIIFYACVVMNFVMFFTFLVEMSAENAKIRHKVFKVEASKVFVALIVFNFMTLIMTSWL
jgi:hypothetical protein